MRCSVKCTISERAEKDVRGWRAVSVVAEILVYFSYTVFITNFIFNSYFLGHNDCICIFTTIYVYIFFSQILNLEKLLWF